MPIIEWIERGWPLQADGTCDTKAASELGLVALSQGLRSLDRNLRSELFAPDGGPWRAFASHLDKSAWPPAFPGAVVLKTEPRLLGPLGRDLVLALLEWRDDPSGRAFLRCVWFILPSEWRRDALTRGVTAACAMLLRHRGRRARPEDTPALRVCDDEALALPRITATSEREHVVDRPSSPKELIGALVDCTLGDRVGVESTQRTLERGIAVLCDPQAGERFGAFVCADDQSLAPDWRHPIPYDRKRAASPPPSRPRPLQANAKQGSQRTPNAAPFPADRRLVCSSVLFTALLVANLVQIALMLAVLLRPYQLVSLLGGQPLCDAVPQTRTPLPRAREASTADGQTRASGVRGQTHRARRSWTP